MKERVYTFGAEQVLMGVLCEPAAPRAGAPAIVVSNVGLNPRSGPNRVWVTLARSLAAQGFTTLRFDLNGLGDSLPRRDARGDFERAVADLGEALDFLEKKRGFTRFVVMGMCSGVDSAHRVATVDPRVVGAVFLDGYTWETVRSKLRWKVGRHLTAGGILRNLRRRLPRVSGLGVGEGEEIYSREYPAREAFAADLELMLGRDAHLLFVFTGGLWMYFNYREQFFDMLKPARFEGRVEVDFKAEADHTFMVPRERAWLVARLTGWVSSKFPAAP